MNPLHSRSIKERLLKKTKTSVIADGDGGDDMAVTRQDIQCPSRAVAYTHPSVYC